ncbi:unconventional myosin-XVIIIb-like [Sceloporus undulatus]|uniref:unconventional myosin-XVIIIb-like n=1 Tax=Sceloporus undulatus TaxID=8520 RepID=UPI001C4C82A4|nr:unconventional myosin-XVIIIb-like [Sceloporus undulatus]
MKAEAKEMAEREMEANRRRMELEKQVDELSAMRQTLQADLETSIRRIADLQAALEEVQSSDESDAERYRSKIKFCAVLGRRFAKNSGIFCPVRTRCCSKRGEYHLSL